MVVNMDENKEVCTCGGDCDCNSDASMEDITVTLTLDNDEELECGVLCIFTADSKEYIALLPLDDEDGEVLLYRYTEVDGNPTLDMIESDDEYEIVADAFDEWLDEQEFEEMQAALDSEE